MFSKSDLFKKVHKDQKLGNHKEAIETLKRIPNWERNEHALIAMGKSYMAIEAYEEAICSSQKVQPGNEDIQNLIAIAKAMIDTEVSDTGFIPNP